MALRQYEVRRIAVRPNVRLKEAGQRFNLTASFIEKMEKPEAGFFISKIDHILPRAS